MTTTYEVIKARCNSPEQKEKDEWYLSSMKKTLDTIQTARAKLPKNPADISARWDYPKAMEDLQILIDAFEGKRNYNDETDRIEETLERKHLLPNEDWRVETSRLRMLGHSDAEIQQLLVRDKVSKLVDPTKTEETQT